MAADLHVLLQQMADYVPLRDWAGLEDQYRSVCLQLAGRDATESIAAVDTSRFQADLVETLTKAVRRAVLHRMPGIYVECDPDNDWNSFVAILRQLDNGQDLDWLRKTREHWDGPSFPEFAQLWPRSLDETDADVGRATFIAARSIAALGRACDAIVTYGISVYFGRHEDFDSTILISGDGEPDYESITPHERETILAAESAARASVATAQLADLVDTAAERDAIASLAKVGAKMGKYPETMRGIDYVHLEGTEAGDNELLKVACLPSVRQLTLNDTRVTDSGLRHLHALIQLRWLNLDHTRITDASLVYLEQLVSLKDLSLFGTRVTDAGLVRLRAHLPNTSLWHDEMFEPTSE